MPSTSERQRKFFGAELGRKRAGEKTKTGMSESQLKDFAKKVPKKRKRGSGELSPLGQRVMQGYEKKFGDEGHARFEAAVREGRVDRDKMFRRASGGTFQRRTG
jgi:hypothetical protein